MLRLGQEPPVALPVALKHLQLQEEGALHVPLYQPPERLLGLQSPEQPHGLQAGEAASRQRRAAGEVQLPVVARLVAGTGLEELSGLVPQGRPQSDLLPRAQALHGDGQRLIEEAAGGGRQADRGGHGGQPLGGSCPGTPRGAGPGQPPLPGARADPAQGAGTDLPHASGSLPPLGADPGADPRETGAGLGPGVQLARPGREERDGSSLVPPACFPPACLLPCRFLLP